MTSAPPPTRRDDDVVETLHGVDVADPYRWLEDQESDQVAAWVKAQAAHARALLDAIPARQQIRDRLEQIWDYPKAGVPWHREGTWLQFRNTGLQQQAVLWTMTAPEEEGRIVLDPADLSDDGTVSLAGVSLSPDGRLIAYGLSDGGSDWITWRIRDVQTAEDLDDEVRWAKFSGAAWLPDSSGFFYGAFDPPAPGQELAATNTHHKLRFHALGTDPTDDPIVHRDDAHPNRGFSPVVTHDGRWLVVFVSEGTDPKNGIWLARLDRAVADLDVTPWLNAFDAEWQVVGAEGDRLIVTSDLDAPNGMVLALDATADPEDPDARETVIAEGLPLLSVSHVAGHLLVVRMVDAVHRLTIHRLDGAEVAEVELPDLGSVGAITGRPDDVVAHLSASSFTRSPAILRLDVAAGVATEIRAPGVEVVTATTELHLVDSTEGARVPLFLIRPADAVADGTLPVILYGYGGFGIPLNPEFRLWWTAWLERGGAIAVGCFRGGAEYGRTWHDAGRLANKARTYDDAIACAEWLESSGWAAPKGVAVTGGSNGGLTAAASVIRRPDLFGACVPEVGVLDLLRFHRFTIGWAWTSDYGDPEDPDDFVRLLGLSPLHTLAEGTCYPPTMVVTADHDDRVVPAHSFKFVAALQRAQGCDKPVIARIDQRAGHGAGTPTSKLIDARADVLAFLEAQLPRGTSS